MASFTLSTSSGSKIAAPLTDTEIDNFAIDLSFLQAAFDSLADYEYDGFNPKSFKAFLIKHWNSKGMDRAMIGNAIIAALSIVLMRGIKINIAGNHKMKKIALESATTLQSIGVTMKPTSGSQPANVITLGRIQSVFPLETSVMLASHKARVVGDRPANLPFLFCHSSIYSILPVDVVSESPFMAALSEWRLSFTKTIMPGKTTEQVIKSMQDFDLKIFNSALYTAVQRQRLLITAIKAEMSVSTPEQQIAYATLLNTDPAMAKLLAASS